MEQGEFSFFIGQKATRKKFTSNQWNWALNSLSNPSPEYILFKRISCCWICTA